MIVLIKDKEIKEGARGDYLKVSYTTQGGKDSGKAIFNKVGDVVLRDKWDMCQKNQWIDLVLDEKYNVIDIREASQPQAEEKPPATAETPPKTEIPIQKSPEDTRNRHIQENMTINEIGEHLRAGTIIKIFGVKLGGELMRHYQDFILINSGLYYEESDLPKINKP